MKQKFSAIFWDNDGVLVDTEHLFFESCRHILAEHGITLDLPTFIDLSLGEGRSCFELMADNGASHEAIEAARQARDDQYSERLSAGIPLIPGVADTLKTLQGTRPMAIVTSCQRQHFERMHRCSPIMDCFEFVLAHGDYTHHKPHPEPYLTAARRLGVDPKRCLVIEDSERGVRAATQAGMCCAVVPTRLTHHIETKAHVRLRTVSDVLSFL